MINWDSAQDLFQKTTGDYSADGLTVFKAAANICYKNILNEFGRPDTEKSITRLTVTSQRGYQLQVDAAWVKAVTIKVGSSTYPLIEETSQNRWDQITSEDIESSTPSRFFVKKRFGLSGQVIEIDPIPSNSTSTLRVVYEPTDRDLQYDVYSTGTVTVTNASENVTGSGTVFTTRMVNQYLKTTDGLYYKIAQYSSTTALILENVYIGNTESGASYGIYDLFNIPEDMHPIPVYYGFMEYYGSKENSTRQVYYERRYTTLFKQARARYGTKTRSNIVTDLTNGLPASTYPNYFPTTMS